MGATKKLAEDMEQTATTPRRTTKTGSKLAKAIIKVMQEVKGMEKNSTVGTGRNAYNGTKDQDVKEVFNDALANNGLCILPIEIDPSVTVSRWDAVDYNGKPTQKQSVFTEVKTKYILLHESGESMELAGYGHGVDTQDKGAGKATTYALKNCLLYTFLTPVGKIDDTDTTHSNDIPTQPQQKPELKIGTQAFDKVNKYISEGGKISEVEKKYTISETIKQILISK